MDNLQQRIADLQRQQAIEQQAIEQRRREEKDAASAPQRAAATAAELRKLKIEQAAQEFEAAMIPQNQRVITEYDAMLAAYASALDRLDLVEALRLKPAIEQAWQAWRQQKINAVSLLRDEFDLALEEAHRNPLGGPETVAAAFNTAYGKRWQQLANAVHPGAYLAQYVGSKAGAPRQIAAGLAYALTGMLYNPGVDYSAQADTDRSLMDDIRNGR